ncbi:glutamate ABC transporter substrate-binding protein [Amycolatopsis sp. SID8362]|uniref:glutamate ABC transporter substrate-binding protein n=1 Tax=Amycolatopsis sp. SID8362 TaxID=2690346 RepID=UPI00136A636C|nr:glutamate ABC transporter substrate-binding protein [Amycolatopsis sp. SID8362]NBH07779.1 transporter substrate-binding domain-containing protein [Amycolatopsis sp. SID8362]NED44474.1 glutamate ABC transporter substrate-binding protein [Amycolatopsis sp. SID8362]
MRLNRVLQVGAVVMAAGLALTACGGGSGSGASGDKNLVQRAKDNKKLVIGIKFDQPGLGLKKPDGTYAGFDVDVAKYIAKQLGVEESGITWKEAQSAQREDLIKKGEVDFIVATYSITDKRKNDVSFGGPYFVAHQDLLVRQDNTDITGPESLTGNKKLCSVKGSTPAQNVKTKYAKEVQLQEVGKYTDCVTALLNGTVDAMTTDDVILAGYAAQQPGKLKLVGKGFTDENYGVGLKKDDADGKAAINKAIQQMEQDGSWAKSLETNVGPSGYKIPAAPAIAP